MKNGFSLIELLCVLGLIGLLSTFAYPNYTQHLTRARRLDSISALLDLAARLEQYHLHHNTYHTATLGMNQSTDILHQTITPAGWYQLRITKATQTEYQLEAIPINAQAKRDRQCPRLTLDSQGHEGENSVCWGMAAYP